MSDFMLITCRDRENSGSRFKEYIIDVCDSMRNLFRNTDFSTMVKRFSLYQNVNCYLLQLPADRKGNPRANLRKLISFLKTFCTGNAITSCIPCGSTAYVMQTKNTFPEGMFKNILFRALAPDLLKKAASLMPTDFNDIDICIIAGQNIDELYEFIKFLSHTVKFITVFTPDKDSINRMIDDIYNEYGLSVAVTDDVKSAFIGKAAIINLGCTRKCINGGISVKNMMILNYGELEDAEVFCGGKVINGISIGLPEHIKAKIHKNIFKCCSESDVASIVLYHRAEKDLPEEFDKCGSSELMKLARYFYEDGYDIKCFYGMHSMINL